MINLFKKIRSLIFDLYYLSAWKLHKDKRKKNCLNTEGRQRKIVISLTTFPGRIQIVHKTIRTILSQSLVKPDIVELWLAEEQFPLKEAELPQKLLELKKYGLLISWYDDIRSYKKLVPALRKYKDDIIVTTDDDVYYSNDWLQKLYMAYENDKSSIHCHRATKFYMEKSEFEIIPGGKEFYSTPSFLNKLVGVGGVLYPPGSLNDSVLDEDLFMKIAQTNDDIWFWLMAVKEKTKISVVAENEPRPIDVFKSEGTEKLSSINDSGQHLFWEQFYNMIDYYPDVKKKLLEEWKLEESL